MENRTAVWIGESSPITEKNYENYHHTRKKTLAQDSKKLNKTSVFSNLQDKSEKGEPNFELGYFVGTADFRAL